MCTYTYMCTYTFLLFLHVKYVSLCMRIFIRACWAVKLAKQQSKNAGMLNSTIMEIWPPKTSKQQIRQINCSSRIVVCKFIVNHIENNKDNWLAYCTHSKNLLVHVSSKIPTKNQLGKSANPVTLSSHQQPLLDIVGKKYSRWMWIDLMYRLKWAGEHPNKENSVHVQDV